jgi:hypothetical protein
MYVRHSIVFASILAVVTSASVFAQGAAAPGGAAAPSPRWYVAAIGGAVSRPPTAPVFSVEVAEQVGRRAQAYFTLSYFENLMGQSLRDDLAATGTRLSALTGTTWRLAGRDRGLAFVAGGKYQLMRGAVRPYVGGGFGTINLKRTVVDSHLGDVTRAVFNDFELGDVDLSRATEGLTRPLAEATVGVGFGAGSTHVDVGYRYRTVLRLANPLDFSQITVGIGYRF